MAASKSGFAGTILKFQRMCVGVVTFSSRKLSLLIRKGANVEIGKNSAIVVERGGHLFIEKGAVVKQAKRETGIVFKEGESTNTVNARFEKRLK